MTLLKNSKLYFVLLLSIFIVSCSSPEETALVETDLGKFRIKFFFDVAPKHVVHFKKLAREGFYNGLAFHRILPNNLIQGGDPTTRGDDRSLWGRGEPGQERVPAEFNSRPFVRGTVGAARAQDPNSATSQFFVSLKDHPEWNGQYTVFGQVVEGLDVVQAISNAPRLEGTDRVRDKIVIRRVTIEKAGEQSKP